MRGRRFVALLLSGSMLLSPSLSYGWNATGLRAVAVVAFQHLDEDTRNRVIKFLEKHPAAKSDPWTIFPINSQDRGLNLFINAATFPDDVRPGGQLDVEERDADGRGEVEDAAPRGGVDEADERAPRASARRSGAARRQWAGGPSGPRCAAAGV